ncbi:signal peptidase I [methanogenic archaeon ISO4-H5]|nr:signal peptidase I [methanogenic archaeon ISO4-H5]
MAFSEKFLTKKNAVTIAAVAIIALSIFFVFFNLNGNSADFSNRDIRLIITDSMDGEPQDYEIRTIPKDSLVMVEILSDSEKENLKVGDVVQFRYGNVYNHHRVIANDVESRTITTQGDNTDAPDSPMSYDKVRGKVVGVNHVLGELVTFVKAYVLVILIFFVAVYVAIRLVEEIRKEKGAS